MSLRESCIREMCTCSLSGGRRLARKRASSDPTPAKCSNKGVGISPAEGMEGRQLTKENTGQADATQIQSWGNASDGLRRVREAAKRDKQLGFTALLHHVSVALLTNGFYALKREAAPGRSTGNRRNRAVNTEGSNLHWVARAV